MYVYGGLLRSKPNCRLCVSELVMLCFCRTRLGRGPQAFLLVALLFSQKLRNAYGTKGFHMRINRTYIYIYIYIYIGRYLFILILCHFRVLCFIGVGGVLYEAKGWGGRLTKILPARQTLTCFPVLVLTDPMHKVLHIHIYIYIYLYIYIYMYIPILLYIGSLTNLALYNVIVAQRSCFPGFAAHCCLDRAGCARAEDARVRSLHGRDENLQGPSSTVPI